MVRHVVLGATGNVGGAVVRELLSSGETVIVVARDHSKTAALKEAGAQIAIVDIGDSDALRDVFRQGQRAFLLNPPARPDTDTDTEERRTVASILAALSGSGLEKVVAASTYGAQPGEALGDLSVLYELERGLDAQSIPVAVNRGAYYFVNWDASLDTACDDGVIRTPFPADFLLPMVDPGDVGRLGARRLMSGLEDVGLKYIEGPAPQSPNDVADAFAVLLHRTVEVETVPRDKIEDMFGKLGFSPTAARSYAAMTKCTLENPPFPQAPKRGRNTLWNHIAQLVSQSD